MRQKRQLPQRKNTSQRKARSSKLRRHRGALNYRRLQVESLEDRRLLATVTVNTELDTVDFNDNITSLREAIFATNLVDGPDTINFDFGHDGPATIRLTHGELAITDHLTIEGPGPELLTIDASGNDPTPELNNGDGTRVLNIDDGDPAVLIDVNVSSVTLTGGDTSGPGGAIRSRENLTIVSSVITDNNTFGLPGTGGGGVSSGIGHLNIVGSTISHNSARSSGGGINGISGKITISHSNIHANQTRISGGGLNAGFTEVTMSDSVVSGNHAEIGVGGGIASDRGPLVIRFSQVTENTVDEIGLANGGGVASANAPMFIVDSTISNNAAARGAGIWNVARDEIATISNSTISGNVATSAGGGIYNRSGQFIVQFSTITGNTAPNGFGGGLASYGMNYAPLRVYSSIVAGNTNSDLDFVGFANSFQSLGFNLIGLGNASGRFTERSDVTGVVDPLLGPLADNGGPTRTHAILPTSPALNAGDPAARAGVDGVPLGDQRGAKFTRVYGGRVDIGAFERQPTEFLLGDFNRNNTVDTADLIVWRKANGRSDEFASYVDARGNGDGIVDERDYALWRANFGLQIGDAESAVVEDHPTRDMSQGTDAVAVSLAAPSHIANAPRGRPVYRLRFENDSFDAHSTALIALLDEPRSGIENAEATLMKGSYAEEDTEAADLVFALISDSSHCWQ
jgi:hypothetical protein